MAQQSRSSLSASSMRGVSPTPTPLSIPLPNTQSRTSIPITPPMSPLVSVDRSRNQDQDVDDIPVDEVEGEDGDAMDVEKSGPSASAVVQEAILDVKMAVEIDPMNTSTEGQKPARLLEDESVHLHNNVLKLTDFEVRGTLGTGTFGRVLLVRHRNSSSPSHFALKVLRKTEIIRLRQVEHVNAERYILSRVQHPFIVDLFATFQDSLNVYMLMSYVPGGELFTHLRRAVRFTPDVTRFYLAGIVLALRYLHSFNIIYRDLKPENLLLDSRGYLRLTDFGFAKIVDDRTWTLCGTPEYLAPEIIQSDGHGKAADWWACGVLCYEMLVGHPPFYDEHSVYGIYENILSGKISWPKWVDPLSRSLVRGFLTQDRTKRLGNMGGGVQDILDHPWFRGVDWELLERRGVAAPIIPHTSSDDDTRHFLHLPFPPLNEMPGLTGQETEPGNTLSPTSYQFLEF